MKKNDCYKIDEIRIGKDVAAYDQKIKFSKKIKKARAKQREKYDKTVKIIGRFVLGGIAKNKDAIDLPLRSILGSAELKCLQNFLPSVEKHRWVVVKEVPPDSAVINSNGKMGLRELCQNLALFETRNAMILEDALHLLGEGRRILLLVESLDHLAELDTVLKSHLQSNQDSVISLHGPLKPRERNALLVKARDEGKGFLLLVNRQYLEQEGIDEKKLKIDTLLLAMPVSWNRGLVGFVKCLFLHQPKALIHEYLDTDEIARRKYDTRKNGYLRIGYEIDEQNVWASSRRHADDHVESNASAGNGGGKNLSISATCRNVDRNALSLNGSVVDSTLTMLLVDVFPPPNSNREIFLDFYTSCCRRH